MRQHVGRTNFLTVCIIAGAVLGAGAISGGVSAAAASSVTGADPSAAPRGAANRSVQIVGTGFVSGSTATFPGGGVTVSSTTFVDAAHLTAVVSIGNGAALGARNVQVRVPGPPATTSVCTGCFTVNPKPAITTLSPAARPQGASTQSVTITGTDFVSGAVVMFGGTGVDVSNVSGQGTTLVVSVSVAPSAALGARPVTVTNPDGGFVTKNNAFTVSAKPTITSIAPGAAPQGKTLNVQIIGTGFAANFVAAGGTLAFDPAVTVNAVTRNSATKLTINVTTSGADSLGARDVTVTNPDGGPAFCSGCFTITESPSIAAVSPSSRAQGASGAAVDVSGSGFQPDATVTIPGGGVTVTSVQRNDATSLTLIVTIGGGAAVTARNVVVTNPDAGTATCSGCFRVNAKPTITSAAPSSSAAGASYTIVLNGTALQDGASAVFSGTGIDVNSISGSGTSLTVGITIAADATLGNRSVTVANPDGGSVTKANVFKVLAALPTPPTTSTSFPSTTTRPMPTTSSPATSTTSPPTTSVPVS